MVAVKPIRIRTVHRRTDARLTGVSDDTKLTARPLESNYRIVPIGAASESDIRGWNFAASGDPRISRQGKKHFARGSRAAAAKAGSENRLVTAALKCVRENWVVRAGLESKLPISPSAEALG